MKNDNPPILKDNVDYFIYRVRNLEQYVDFLKSQLEQANDVIDTDFELIHKYENTIKKIHSITNCYDLNKHFIGNHGGTIVYLSPNFEIDFMRRMSRTDELQRQNQQYREVIDRARVLVNNVYNSLENPDKPIKFYEELLDILNINERN